MSTGISQCSIAKHKARTKNLTPRRSMAAHWYVCHFAQHGSFCRHALGSIPYFHINFQPGNPIPLGVRRKGSFFYKKNKKKSLIFFSLLKKSSILNMTEQKSIKSAERRRANGNKRAECNDIHKGKIIS